MALHHKVNQLILSIWDAKDLPQQWYDTSIISIYKSKGDHAIYGNSRRISPPSVVGKVLAKILLARLNINIVDKA